MTSWRGRTLLWGLVLAAAISQSAWLLAQSATPLIERGVYTAAQAERGRVSYGAHCSECHGGDLGGTAFGDGTPALKRDDFMAGRNLKDVFDQVKRAMPFNAPASLTDSLYLDVLAYVLRENGYPAGPQELGPDAARLMSIVLPMR